MIRLSLGLDVIGVDDGFTIDDSDNKIYYEECKRILSSDLELVKLSRRFIEARNDQNLQREICSEMKPIYSSRYSKMYNNLSKIIFRRKITNYDAESWINEWEPDLLN